MLAHYTSWVTLKAEAQLRSLYAPALEPTGERGAMSYVSESPEHSISQIFEVASEFSEGLAAVVPVGASGFGYINPQGETILPGPFAWAGDFSEGKALVSPVIGNRQIIDAAGNTVLECGSSQGLSKILAYSEGAAIVKKESELGFYDLDSGSSLFQAPGEAGQFLEILPFQQGKSWVRTSLSGWGQIRRNLQTWFLPPSQDQFPPDGTTVSNE